MMAPRPAPRAVIHDDVDVRAVKPTEEPAPAIEDEPEDEPGMARYVEDEVEVRTPAAVETEELAPAVARREETEMDIPAMPADVQEKPATTQVDMFGQPVRDVPKTASNDTIVVGREAAAAKPAPAPVAAQARPAVQQPAAEEADKPKKEPLFSLRRFLRSEDDDTDHEEAVRREPTARPAAVQPAAVQPAAVQPAPVRAAEPVRPAPGAPAPAPVMTAPAVERPMQPAAAPAPRREAAALDDAGDPNRARTVRLTERPGRRPEVTVTQPAARVENNDEDDLLEIPAFLRRQAN